MALLKYFKTTLTLWGTNHVLPSLFFIFISATLMTKLKTEKAWPEPSLVILQMTSSWKWLMIVFFLLWCDSITSPFLYWSVVLWPAARTECSWDDGVFGPCGDLPSLPESSAGVRVQLVEELQANGDPTQAGKASCEEPHNYFIKETKTGSGLWHRISTGKLFSLFYANMFSFFHEPFFFFK